MHQILPGRAELEQHAKSEPMFARWQKGYGPIEHTAETQADVYRLAHQLVQAGTQPDLASVYQLFCALDQVTAAAMRVVVHMTYANRIAPDGAALAANDFKTHPEGHTGGALNMVPGYAAFMAFNALTGETRAWLMGQGHSVAAVEALNVMLDNLNPEQAQAYGNGEQGLNQFLQDVYSYALSDDGRPAAPLGSHVTPHTAGGIMEGGYLGFAELQYAHMPIPGQKLIAFLSDGAAEEQRGSDWVPRWWRAEDSGPVFPIMIANGRRIEQRTELGTIEGMRGFMRHLSGCGFDPIEFDGRDPAAFVTTLWEMEQRLERRVQEKNSGIIDYPLPIPYGIANTVKGFGFYGADENSAHNLPLPGNPSQDTHSRELFNSHAQALFVPSQALQDALQLLKNHPQSGRPLERDHPLVNPYPPEPVMPALHYTDQPMSAMAAVDRFFVDLVQANPELRPRVGNPDELASNRLTEILAHLKHRVNEPENASEAQDGQIITVLNEEAVISACLANRNGLNLAASYEAFCPKMLGAIRQNLTFARQQKEIDRPAGWLGWPVIATSHTWENGKNQQSHQDTAFCETLLGEMNDVSRVLFPADYNSMLALLPQIYSSRGQIACVVASKQEQPMYFTQEQAEQLAQQGAIIVEDFAGEEPILLIANGSYQLGEVLRAAARLREADVAHRVVYMQEPGRFRAPRDRWELDYVASAELVQELFPKQLNLRVLLTHMRPEVIRGHLWPILPNAADSYVSGFRNRGGTLDVFGMQFANRACWANVVAACARLHGIPRTALLTVDEAAAVAGKGNPETLR